ncbi:hypothetical protein [Apilactobacillus timberlakei]|uniref:hypothetical protein n=1 Tax=Apilactobacillus timberlakei TaxID=2008380 RepID=UPI00112D962F|nr:hypothetical protein [Apilactobacillus timberlakei]TPR16702.1 hypothetical protein DYZ95_06910 [Apilactobacillus timberlakei]
MPNFEFLNLLTNIANNYPTKIVTKENIIKLIPSEFSLENINLDYEYQTVQRYFNLIEIKNISNMITKIMNDNLTNDMQEYLNNHSNSDELIDLNINNQNNAIYTSDDEVVLNIAPREIIEQGLLKPLSFAKLSFRIGDMVEYFHSHANNDVNDYKMARDKRETTKYLDKGEDETDKLISIVSEIAMQVPNNFAKGQSIMKLLDNHGINSHDQRMTLCGLLIDNDMMPAKEFMQYVSVQPDFHKFKNDHPLMIEQMFEQAQNDFIFDVGVAKYAYEDNAHFMLNFQALEKMPPKPINYKELLNKLKSNR